MQVTNHMLCDWTHGDFSAFNSFQNFVELHTLKNQLKKTLNIASFYRTWDHHDILSVLPEYNTSNRCSISARIRSIAPYNGRKETAIYATDIHTGIVIRCKVFIDIFSRIQIFHNSIKLDLDGLATLRVRAFDSEGIGSFDC